MAFYKDLKNKFKAPGEFAEADVIAHEIGHHVQNLLGVSEKIRAQQSRVSEKHAKELSVRLELQADYLAGAWGFQAQKKRPILEPVDSDDCLHAASAIGA